MPRRSRAVKAKPGMFRSWAPVDLHFHGAFGIDLMSAEAPELDRLAFRLARRGLGAFCPTTLSAPKPVLLAAVARLGAWIQSVRRRDARAWSGALPLGIHLEGPFIHPGACGAHPPTAIRPFRRAELLELWEASRQTLKIVTLAPERLKPGDRKWLVAWSRAHGVVLQIGHSRLDEASAAQAFDHGFRGVTHAWNAMPFHQRAPGILGAALGRPDVHVELILDGVHVHPEVADWTLRLHRKVCAVSDCAPPAATGSGGKAGSWISFGPLRCRWEGGACRVAGGHLAGGGLLLPEALRLWALRQGRGKRALQALREILPAGTLNPLRALGLTPAVLKGRRLEWRLSSSGLPRQPRPVR